MKFSCSLPVDDIGDDGFLSIEGISQMAQAAERAGVDAVFVTDHPAPSRRWLDGGGHATLDPFVALTAAAAATTRLRLHTHILVLAYRNPFVVAKSVASLDRLSGGRFIMGIGTGYLKPEYAAVGANFDERGAITDEAIKVMRMAWSGQPVSHVSTYFSARDACVLPTPVQAPLPIWAGGNSARAIRRAVELCEGWCPFPVSGIVAQTTRTEELSSIEQLHGKIQYAREQCERAGRIAPLDICISSFRSGSMKPEVRADTSRLIDEYAALAEAGVSWTTVSVTSPSRAAFIENVQWLGEEVVSRLPGRQHAAQRQ
jgi:probable F420-dependent oxidoreductase